jgi:hypothetical protein
MYRARVQQDRRTVPELAKAILLAVVYAMSLSSAGCSRSTPPAPRPAIGGDTTKASEPSGLPNKVEENLTGVTWVSPLPGPEERPPPRPTPTRVALVAPLHADQSDTDSKRLGETIADMLAIALADQGNMRVVERGKLVDLLQEQKLALSGLVDPATAARMGKLLAAEVVVVGSLIETKAKVRGAILVVAVDGQRVLGNVDLDSSPEGLVTHLVMASTQVARLAGAKLPVVKEIDLDDSPVGRLHLIRGVGFYHANNWDQAIVSCLRAVQLDPRLQEARLWIARSYLKLGEKSHARAELNLLANNPAAKPFTNDIQQLLKASNAAR